MPRHVECDDSEVLGDGGVVQDATVLPRIRTCRMQAKQRNALARLLEIDPMCLLLEIQMGVAPDDRLDFHSLRGEARTSFR